MFIELEVEGGPLCGWDERKRLVYFGERHHLLDVSLFLAAEVLPQHVVYYLLRGLGVGVAVVFLLILQCVHGRTVPFHHIEPYARRLGNFVKILLVLNRVYLFVSLKGFVLCLEVVLAVGLQVVMAVAVAEALTGLEVGLTFIFTPVFVNLHSPLIIYILTLVLSLNIIR